jgi:hypothetical protein
MIETPKIEEIEKPEHETSPNCWCHPVIDEIAAGNGSEVWVHNDVLPNV